VNSLLLACALFLNSTGGGRAPAELVTKVYDLATAAPAFHGSEISEELAPYLVTDYREARGELDPWSSPDAIAELVVGVFSREFEFEGRSLELIEDGRMRVTAPAALHKDVAALLAFLEQSFRRSVELRVDWIDRPAGAPVAPALMPIAEADKFVASGSRVRSATLSVSPGRAATLDVTRDVELVCDYDVEIAQATAISDPVVRVFEVGTRATVRAAAVRGGVQLAGFLRSGAPVGALKDVDLELGAMVTTDKGVERFTQRGRIQSLSVLQRTLGLSAFVPDGQAVVVELGLDSRTGAARQAIVIRSLGTAKEPLLGMSVGASKTRLDVLDSSWLAPPRLRYDGEWLAGTRSRRASTFGEEWSEPVTLRAGDSSYVESVLVSLGSRTVTSLGPWILVFADGREGGEGEAQALAMTHPALASASTPEVAGVVLTLRRGADAAALWSLPLCGGETSCFSASGETLVVKDVDVEVAQSSCTADPQVGARFDGVLGSVRGSRAQDGAWTVDVALRAHLLAAPATSVDTGNPIAIAIDRGEYDDLALSERVVLSAQSRRASLGLAGELQLEIELR
jgi:hypothetical protein